MRMIKFKSLTVRIWITFVLFASSIILGISFFYFGIIKNIEKANRLNTLHMTHDMLVQGDQVEINYKKANKQNQEAMFEVNHLLIKKGETIGVMAQSLMRRNSMPPIELHYMANWFLKFIEQEDEQDIYGLYYEGKLEQGMEKGNICFVISEVNNNLVEITYIVSYIKEPPKTDNLAFVLGIGFLFILISLIAAKVISNYICNPLEKLEEQAFKIANKEWIPPIEVESEDEIGRLIHAINYMQRTLQQADQEEQKFLQTISHDLKTPIMVIMGHAEAILDGMYIESVEHTAEIIKLEAQRLEGKVKQILYYNTLDYMLDNESEHMVFHLEKLIRHMVIRFRTINPKVHWEMILEPTVIIANSERIQVAVENILDNQLRYAENKIKIQLKREEEQAVLEVYNDGPSIEVEHITHIFDDLYKGRTGNFGLGLSITKKIIQFYGGNIEVSNQEVGVSFKIAFPIAEEINNRE